MLVPRAAGERAAALRDEAAAGGGDAASSYSAPLLTEAFGADRSVIPWAPVLRSDISWNFEKFLLGK